MAERIALPTATISNLTTKSMNWIANEFPPQNTSGIARGQRGFSLVEISAALGIVSFAFVALLGLMADGVGKFRGAMDTTITAQIASRMINDAQQAEFSELVGSHESPENTERKAVRYFDEQGNEIVPAEESLSPAEQLRVVYRVGTRVRPQAELPQGYFSDTPQLAQVTIQVVHVPGEADLEVETRDGAGQNLFKAGPGVPVYTYSALVARIQ